MEIKPDKTERQGVSIERILQSQGREVPMHKKKEEEEEEGSSKKESKPSEKDQCNNRKDGLLFLRKKY